MVQIWENYLHRSGKGAPAGFCVHFTQFKICKKFVCRYDYSSSYYQLYCVVCCKRHVLLHTITLPHILQNDYRTSFPRYRSVKICKKYPPPFPQIAVSEWYPQDLEKFSWDAAWHHKLCCLAHALNIAVSKGRGHAFMPHFYCLFAKVDKTQGTSWTYS